MPTRLTPARCDTYWGSHGCDLPPGHPGGHECGAADPDGLCSTAEIDGRGMAHVRYYPLGGCRLAGEKVYLMPAMRGGGREWIDQVAEGGAEVVA